MKKVDIEIEETIDNTGREMNLKVKMMKKRRMLIRRSHQEEEKVREEAKKKI